MRKKVIIIAAIAICTFLGYFQVQKVQSKASLTDIELMNIEALAYGSETTGNTVDCYSESAHKRGATYYDCGDCSKQFNQKGVGSQRTCQTPN